MTDRPVADRDELCHAAAIGGPCVLPRGHNMGKADVPSNHRASADRPVADREHIGVHRAGYRSDCPACIANDERISARPVADREPLSAGREPRTEAGRRLLNDVREVVVHGVTDRVPAKGFGFAWHVQRGIAAIEDESLDAARAHPDEAGLREALEGLSVVTIQGVEMVTRSSVIAVAAGHAAQPAVPVAGAEAGKGETHVHEVIRHTHSGWSHDHVLTDDAFAAAGALRVLRAAQPEDDVLDAGSVVEAIWREIDEHRQDIATCSCGEWTPYGSVGTTFAWHVAQKVAARLSESSEGVERRDG